MKCYKLIVLFVLLLTAGNVFAQRNSQIEFYGGAAFPMSPDGFKDYTKVGLSGNLQYVIFPSPRFGITFNVGYERFSTDNEKFTSALVEQSTGQTVDFFVQNFGVDPSADITASALRFGAGIRPYLTKPEASTQFFLLGQVNYNLIKNDWKVTDIPFLDELGNLGGFATGNDSDFESALGDNDESKFGFGAGAGVEIPAGSSFNIVLQGLFNVVLTEGDNTSFIGVTAGVVF